jgi:hypothetical protein
MCLSCFAASILYLSCLSACRSVWHAFLVCQASFVHTRTCICIYVSMSIRFQFSANRHLCGKFSRPNPGLFCIFCHVLLELLMSPRISYSFCAQKCVYMSNVMCLLLICMRVNYAIFILICMRVNTCTYYCCDVCACGNTRPWPRTMVYPPTGPESQSESQARLVPGRPSEFNFSDHFCLQNGRVEAFVSRLDSEPAGGV